MRKMSSTHEKGLGYYTWRKTGNITDSPITELITDEDLLDDRDQGSPPTNLKSHEEEEAVAGKSCHSRDTLSTVINRDDGSKSCSSYDEYEQGVKRQKSRPRRFHRQHRRTKSSPNSVVMFSPLESQTISESAYKPQCNNYNMKKSNRRTRAVSYSQLTQKHYGALEGIAEDEVMDISLEEPSPSIPNLNQDFHCYKYQQQSRLPQRPRSELIESARAYLSQSQGCYNHDDITIQMNLSKRIIDDDKKSHRRQRSVEQYMENVKGTDQTLSCRDSIFAILFIMHIIVVLWIGLQYGSDALIEKTIEVDGPTSIGHSENMWVVEGTDLSFTYKKVISLACICGISSMGLSMLAFFVMTIFSTCLIQVALCLAISLGFLWGTVGIILAPENFVPLTGIFALGLTIAYTFVVWDRIPLASIKLKVGLSTLQGRKGIILFTFIIQIVFLLWSIFFTYAAIGVYDAFKDLLIPSTNSSRLFSYVGLIFSYIWTFQVSMHVVEVGVAGVVKEWWFDSGTSSTSSLMCSKASKRSILRASFFSFGSICFGSLLVGIMNTLRQIGECILPKHELIPSCGHYYFVACQEFAISSIRSLGSFFNHWAFIYVGLYGYSFITASRNATALIKKRGWEYIVNDDLISNILFMVSLLIGGTIGCFAVLLESSEGSNFTSMTNPPLMAFVIGFSIGAMLSSILFSTIRSAVDSVIICFAGSPVEFESNHKALSHELRLAWKTVWPGSVDFVYDSNIPLDILESNQVYTENDAAFVNL